MFEHDAEEEIHTEKHTRHSQLFQYLSVAFTGGLIAIGFQVLQSFQLMFLFLVPVPIVIVTLRYSSLLTGILTVGAATLSISLMAGPQMGMQFFLSAGIAAAILAICFLRNVSATVTLISITAYYMLLAIIFFSFQQGVTFDTYAETLMTIFKTQFTQMYQSRGVTWQEIESQIQVFARVFSVISPLLSALSSSLIMYLMCRGLLKVWKIALPPVGQFHHWEASEFLVWGFILGGVLYHVELTRVVGINVLLGLVLLYYLQGCAIITFFLKHRHTGKLMQALAYMLLFLQIPYIFVNLGLLLTGSFQENTFLSLPAIILVAGIGLANVWIGFRQRVEQQIAEK